MQAQHYHRQASLIQATWRGYRSRKLVLDFYKRKEYFKSLQHMNDVVRQGLRQYEQDLKTRLEDMRQREEQAKETARFRKTHYQLSTLAHEGVLAKTGGLEDKMRTLRKQELKTTTLTRTARLPALGHPAAPSHEELPDCSCSRTLPQALPRMQGPFRPPPAVQSLRNRPLRPTLRVSTRFDSEKMASTLERQDELTRRINDKGFQPFSRVGHGPYLTSMRRDGAYNGLGPGDARMAYGTSLFRDELPQLATSKAFKTVVPPVVLFDDA